MIPISGSVFENGGVNNVALRAEACENQKAPAGRNQVQMCRQARHTDCRLTLAGNDSRDTSALGRAPSATLRDDAPTADVEGSSFSAWSPGPSCGRRGSAGDCPLGRQPWGKHCDRRRGHRPPLHPTFSEPLGARTLLCGPPAAVALCAGAGPQVSAKKTRTRGASEPSLANHLPSTLAIAVSARGCSRRRWSMAVFL